MTDLPSPWNLLFLNLNHFHMKICKILTKFKDNLSWFIQTKINARENRIFGKNEKEKFVPLNKMKNWFLNS